MVRLPRSEQSQDARAECGGGLLGRQAIGTGDRLAARFTIHAEMRRGRTISTEVYLFGELAPDGRIRRTTQATRDVSV